MVMYNLESQYIRIPAAKIAGVSFFFVQILLVKAFEKIEEKKRCLKRKCIGTNMIGTNIAMLMSFSLCTLSIVPMINAK